MRKWFSNALLSKFCISESHSKLWKVSQNAVWPRSACTHEYFISSLQPAPISAVSLGFFHLPSAFPPCVFFHPNMSVTPQTFLHLLSTKTPTSSTGGWNRRVWNMKQSYVRTIQAAVEKLSRVKHLCTRKHTCTQIHSVLPPKKHLEEDLLLHSWFSFFGQFWNLHCVLQGTQNGDPLI